MLIAQIVSLILAIILPGVAISVYFYAKADEPSDFNDDQTGSTDKLEISAEKVTFSGTRALGLLWHHFKSAYANFKVLQWSLWWALAMCGFMQVMSSI